jgi:hypothetical protein
VIVDSLVTVLAVGFTSNFEELLGFKLSYGMFPWLCISVIMLIVMGMYGLKRVVISRLSVLEYYQLSVPKEESSRKASVMNNDYYVKLVYYELCISTILNTLKARV